MSASGMADAGRIKHHLRNNLPRANATVLFVGYQAPGTLGQIIQSGAKEVRIHSELVPVRARVRSLGSYSAHADHSELVAWVTKRLPAHGAIFLTHGEDEERAALRAALMHDDGLAGDQVIAPLLDDAFELRAEGIVGVEKPAERRVDLTQVTSDWHNSYASFIIDLSNQLQTATDDKRRNAVMDALKATLSSTGPVAPPLPLKTQAGARAGAAWRTERESSLRKIPAFWVHQRVDTVRPQARQLQHHRLAPGRRQRLFRCHAQDGGVVPVGRTISPSSAGKISGSSSGGLAKKIAVAEFLVERPFAIDLEVDQRRLDLDDPDLALGSQLPARRRAGHWPAAPRRSSRNRAPAAETASPRVAPSAPSATASGQRWAAAQPLGVSGSGTLSMPLSASLALPESAGISEGADKDHRQADQIRVADAKVLGHETEQRRGEEEHDERHLPDGRDIRPPPAGRCAAPRPRPRSG